MVNFIVRLEGVAVFCLATYIYFQISGNWWLYLILALSPDIAALGYLFNSKFGAATYNVFHTYAVTIIVILWGLIFHTHLVLEIGLIWTCHIGADKIFGFGFKNAAKA